MVRRDLLSGLVLALFLIAPRALAGASPEDAALADSLYAEGGKLMEAARWAEACPKIEASWKLDPGIGSTLRLAFCWQKLGRTASASAMYRETEAMARRVGDKRADEAAKYAMEIEPLLSRLVLDVPPENQAGSVEIRRDGKVIDAAAWASGIPMDPGPHVVEAAAAGRLPWKTTITIEARPGVTRLRVPVLTQAPIAPPVPDVTAAPSFWGTQRIIGAVMGGAGLATIAVSLGFGASARTSNNDSLPHCLPNDQTKCYATGLSLRNSAISAAKASTGIFVAGAVLLGSGSITFFTAPAATSKPAAGIHNLQVQPRLGLGAGALTVQGEW